MTTFSNICMLYALNIPTFAGIELPQMDSNGGFPRLSFQASRTSHRLKLDLTDSLSSGCVPTNAMPGKECVAIEAETSIRSSSALPSFHSDSFWVHSADIYIVHMFREESQLNCRMPEKFWIRTELKMISLNCQISHGGPTRSSSADNSKFRASASTSRFASWKWLEGAVPPWGLGKWPWPNYSVNHCIRYHIRIFRDRAMAQ